MCSSVLGVLCATCTLLCAPPGMCGVLCCTAWLQSGRANTGVLNLFFQSVTVHGGRRLLQTQVTFTVVATLALPAPLGEWEVSCRYSYGHAGVLDGGLGVFTCAGSRCCPGDGAARRRSDGGGLVVVDSLVARRAVLLLGVCPGLGLGGAHAPAHVLVP